MGYRRALAAHLFAFPVFVEFTAYACQNVLARFVIVECKHFCEFGSRAPFRIGAIDIVDCIGVEPVGRFEGDGLVECNDVRVCVVDEYEVSD